MFINFYCKKGMILIPFLLLFIFFQSFAFAQTGTVRGSVQDKATKESLTGANIIIKGTSLGAASDIDGNYSIRNIPAGNYTLAVSYVGYNPLTMPITVTAGQTLEQDIILESTTIEGETVVITAQAQGQLEAINTQLSSNRVINVVSSEKMQELPDANLAESIGRLPGISLQRNSGEAEKVVIRGLSPKFNNVTIEGVPMVSTNDFDRSIDLSLIGDDLVQGVEVSKSLQADMDADALGGTVNLKLKNAPKGLTYFLQGIGGYNDLETDWNNYKFTGTVSNRFFEDQLGLRLSLNAEQKQLPSDQFNGNYNTPETYQIINGTDTTNGLRQKTGSVNLTDNNTKRHRYGGSLIIDYASEFVDLQFLNLYSQKDDKSINRANFTRFNNTGQEFGFSEQLDVTDTKTEQRTHSLQSLFKISDTQLNISLAYTKGTADAPDGQRFDFITPQGTNLPNPFGTNDLWFRQPSEAVAEMGVMNPANSQLQNMYFNNFNLTDESYDGKLDFKIPVNLADNLSAIFSLGGKYHKTNRTSDFNQIIDYMQYGAGANARQDLVNKFPWINTVLAHERGIDAINFVDPNYDISNFLDGRWPLGWGADVGKLTSMQTDYYNNLGGDAVYQQREQGLNNYQRDYKDIEEGYAGYLMGEINIGSDLTIIPGIRYQQEKTDISAYHIQIIGANFDGLAGPPTLKEFKRDNPYWYPSINFKYKASEIFQIMGAVYRAVSLPSFREISPLVVYQESGNDPRIVTNNPFLKPSTSWNLDLGASWFGNEVGLLTANVFYKEVSDLIITFQKYQPYLPDSLLVGLPSDFFDRIPPKDYFSASWGQTNATSTANIPLNNANKAYIKGIEVSWQTNLWYLPGLLSGLVIDLNFTFIDSYTLYPTIQQGKQIGGTRLKPIYEYDYVTRQGEVQDQPKAIYNAILGWDYKGFSSRFSLRYQETTVTSLDTRYNLRDSYYDNVLLVDITLKQALLDNLSIYTNLTNINTHIDDYYLVANGERFPTSQQTYGFRAQFGITYNMK